MKFTPLEIGGAFIVEIEPVCDERGFFARTFCREEFTAHGIALPAAQCSTSYNRHKGTLRGMHYQDKPHEEKKLVRCTRGAIHDVILDLRVDSPSFKRWFGLELSADNRKALYIPEGVAHGFLTLTDDSEVLYQISELFSPECAKGVRWDDPAFGIAWPGQAMLISHRDRDYPDFAANFAR